MLAGPIYGSIMDFHSPGDRNWKSSQSICNMYCVHFSRGYHKWKWFPSGRPWLSSVSIIQCYFVDFHCCLSCVVLLIIRFPRLCFRSASSNLYLFISASAILFIHTFFFSYNDYLVILCFRAYCSVTQSELVG